MLTRFCQRKILTFTGLYWGDYCYSFWRSVLLTVCDFRKTVLRHCRQWCRNLIMRITTTVRTFRKGLQSLLCRWFVRIFRTLLCFVAKVYNFSPWHLFRVYIKFSFGLKLLLDEWRILCGAGSSRFSTSGATWWSFWTRNARYFTDLMICWTCSEKLRASVSRWKKWK